MVLKINLSTGYEHSSRLIFRTVSSSDSAFGRNCIENSFKNENFILDSSAELDSVQISFI